MAQVTTSFQTDITDAVCARVLDLCGTGPNAYDDPDYLQIVSATSGIVTPRMSELEEAQMPGFRIQFLFDRLSMERTEMGGENRVLHFALGAVASFTWENLGFDPEPEDAELKNVVDASLWVWQERIYRALNRHCLSLGDSEFDRYTNRCTISRRRILASKVSRSSYTGFTIMEYNVETEGGAF